MRSWNGDLLRFTRAAIAARTADPALRGDGYRTLAAAGSTIAFERSDGEHRAVVAANAGEGPAELTLPGPMDPRSLAESLTSDGRSADVRPGADGGASLTLPARWGGIWRIDHLR